MEMTKRITVTVEGPSYVNKNDAPGPTATARQWKIWIAEIRAQIEHARQIAQTIEK